MYFDTQAGPNIKKFATSIYFHWTTKIRSLLFSIQFISVVNEFIAMIDWENIFKMLNIIWGKVIWYLQAFEHSLFVRFIMIRAIHFVVSVLLKIFGLYHSGEESFCTNGVPIDHAVSHQCMSNIICNLAFLYSSLSNIIDKRGKSRVCQNYYIETFGIFPYMVLKPFIMILLLIDRFGVWLESPWDPPPLVPMRLCLDMKFRMELLLSIAASSTMPMESIR